MEENTSEIVDMEVNLIRAKESLKKPIHIQDVHKKKIYVLSKMCNYNNEEEKPCKGSTLSKAFSATSKKLICDNF